MRTAGCSCGRTVPPCPGTTSVHTPATHVARDGKPTCLCGRSPIPAYARQALDSVEHWTDLLDLPKWSVGDKVTWRFSVNRHELPTTTHGVVHALSDRYGYPIRVLLDGGSVIDPSILPGMLRLA